jgi:hypothetical protein
MGEVTWQPEESGGRGKGKIMAGGFNALSRASQVYSRVNSRDIIQLILVQIVDNNNNLCTIRPSVLPKAKATHNTNQIHIIDKQPKSW